MGRLGPVTEGRVSTVTVNSLTVIESTELDVWADVDTSKANITEKNDEVQQELLTLIAKAGIEKDNIATSGGSGRQDDLRPLAASIWLHKYYAEQAKSSGRAGTFGDLRDYWQGRMEFYMRLVLGLDPRKMNVVSDHQVTLTSGADTDVTENNLRQILIS